MLRLTRGKLDYSVFTTDKKSYIDSITKEQQKTSTLDFESSKEVKEFQ